MPIYAPAASSGGTLIDWKNKPTGLCFMPIAGSRNSAVAISF